MRKITKSLLALALLFGVVGGVKATKLYATYGTPAGEGSWNVETGVYSWTQSYSNLMDLFVFGAGELANYKSLHFTTDVYTSGQEYRICFMTGSTATATIAFYSAGQKDLVFSERTETKDLDLSQITSIKFGGASGSGSITITKKPYLEKPMSLEWKDDGTADIDITDLSASGCFSFDDQTGVLTSSYDAETSTWGRLAINFPTGGVDLSSLTGFEVTYTGTNLFSNFEIGNGTTNKAFYSSIYGRNDLNTYMTAENVGDPTAITIWRWINNTSAGTMTISSIKLKANTIIASNPHETVLTSSMFNSSCTNNFGTSMGQGATIYGEGGTIDGSTYVDLSDYDEMHIYGTPNKTIRMLFNWTSANQAEITGEGVKLDGDGYYSFNLKSLAAHQLNAIKFPWDGQSGVITKVVLYKASVPIAYSYVFAGNGNLSTSAIAALADASATSIDATGITAATELATANPNCLITANAGMVTNAKNVIVSDVCANLELTDGKPFKAPAAFTATNAKFVKTVSDAGYATMVIPFAAALPSGVEAYNLTGVSGETITTTDAASLTADKPVLIKADADDYEFTATSVAIAATGDAEVVNGLLHADYKTQDIAVGSYVLQNTASGVNFYQTDAAITAKPFRAYLVAPTSARELVLDLDVTTGIVSLTSNLSTMGEESIYTLSGQRVEKATKGLYIVNGKKVMVK